MPHRTGRKIQVEETWRCTSCETVNKGRVIICVQCGNPKEKKEKDVLPDDLQANIVTDPELLKTALGGSDWVCPYCGSNVRNADGSCKQCAGTAEEGKKEYVIDDPPAPSGSSTPSAPSPRTREDYRPEVIPERRRYAESNQDDVEDSGSQQSLFVPLIGAIIGLPLLLLCGGLMFYLLTPHKHDGQVVRLTWDIVREVEERRTDHGSDWGDQLPSGAYNKSCHKKEHSGTQCNPHDCNPHSESYDCRCNDHVNCRTDRSSCTSNGNGFASCDEICDTKCDTCNKTVYDTCYDACEEDWCSYDVDSWPLVAKRETSGEGHVGIAAPSLIAHGADQRMHEYQYYIVTFTGDDGKTYAYNTGDASDYQRFNLNEGWKLSTWLVSNSCKPTERQ